MSLVAQNTCSLAARQPRERALRFGLDEGVASISGDALQRDRRLRQLLPPIDFTGYLCSDVIRPTVSAKGMPPVRDAGFYCRGDDSDENRGEES